MHQPLPHGRLAVGGAPTEQDNAAIELLARRLTNLRQLSGVPSLRMLRTLPDGGYVIAQNMGGTFRVITHKPLADQPQESDGLAGVYIPMLFSGVVTKPVVGGDEGVQLHLTEGARRRIANYSGEISVDKKVSLHRFRVEYNPMVKELAQRFESPMFFSQYATQRPTWYSGAMAEVMQIVGGYGRQDLMALPNNPVERAEMILPKDVAKKIYKEINDLRLPGYTGLPPTSGQFQYDYKFNNTHGVSFGSDEKPWLVRVNKSGVWVMPLPLIPATTTEAFREYVEEKGDDEIISILDRFGGMPSGERFPVGESDIYAWKRAGVIIKICEIKDFYEHVFYSSACGWSFNSKGTEGFNTCYDYEPGSGLGYGLAFKMKLSIGSRQYDMLPKSDFSGSDSDMKSVAEYLAKLDNLLRGNSAKNLAIKYKLRRVDANELLSRARSTSVVTNEDVDYWDNLELSEIASCSGSVGAVSRGWLFDRWQPEIKFPEPLLQGCISHIFLPILPTSGPSAYSINPPCDTIMFGYYVGDTLKVVKYFREVREIKPGMEDGFEECMLTGSWTRKSTGFGWIAGRFYTTDFDDRKDLYSVVTTHKITSEPAGVDYPPRFSFDELFSRTGTIWRNHYFLRTNETAMTEGHSMDVAICIPYLCRNAVLHVKRSSVGGSSESSGGGVFSVRDPVSYRYWTNDHLFAWWGGLEDMSQKPYPKNGNPVWVTVEENASGGCGSDVGSGSWIKTPADYTWLVRPKTEEYLFDGGGSPAKVDSTSSHSSSGMEEDGDIKTDIPGEPGFISKGYPPSPMFFLPSPHDALGVFYSDACRVVFGDTIYASSTEPPGYGVEERKRWGDCNLVDNKTAHHFIGVIHE